MNSYLTNAFILAAGVTYVQGYDTAAMAIAFLVLLMCMFNVDS